MCVEENENSEQTANKCPNCHSNEEEQGNTHVHCAECGIPKYELVDDGDFVPANLSQNPGQINPLGSYVGSRDDREIRHDRSMRRLSTLNGRVAHRKPTFLDGVIEQLSCIPGGAYLRTAAADIVKNANSTKPLGSMRHSLRYSPDSSADAKQYRQRLFVCAALELLEDAGNETPITTLRGQWSIDRYDLMKVKSRLKRLVNGRIACLSNAATDPAIARRLAMTHQLSTIRDHLAEQESLATARRVFETAKQIASAMGEPIEDGDDWIISETTNRPASAVACKAFMEAMHKQGLSDESVLELHDRYPVTTIDYFILKKGWERRTDDVSEEA